MLKRSFCIFVAFFLLSVLTVISAEPLKKIKAVYTTWFPYNYEDNSGKAMGFENEIFRSVMQQMNYDVEFVKRPWKRCLHMLQYGETDALVSMLMVEERKAYTIYSTEDISVSRTLLFTHVDNNIVFDGSIEKLKPYTMLELPAFTDFFTNLM